MADDEPRERPPSLELPSLGGWRRQRRAQTPAPATTPTPAEPTATAAGRRPVRRIRVRRPSGYLAVVGGGALVGLLMVVLTWGSLQACERVQGTSSCGAAGYPMLLFVLVLAVVTGGMLLRLLHVVDPVGTSFLGTGLAAVLALLFLVDQLDEPAMVAVVPLLTAACFAAAHWVTATFIEPDGR